MMKKLVSLVVVGAMVFCVAGISTAAPKEGKKKPDVEAQFKKLDADKDGKLSLAEFCGKREGEKKDAAAKAFKRKDKDSDGSLTLEEFSAKPAKKKKDE